MREAHDHRAQAQRISELDAHAGEGRFAFFDTLLHDFEVAGTLDVDLHRLSAMRKLQCLVERRGFTLYAGTVTRLPEGKTGQVTEQPAVRGK